MGSPFDPQALAIIRGQLAALDELEATLDATLRAGPRPDSLAARDAKLPNGRYVTIYAGQMATTSLDHLRAWRALAHGPLIPVQASMTLLRAAIESAAYCRWYVDPAITAGERVGRGWAGRRHDQTERLAFERLGPHPTSARASGMTAEQRLAELAVNQADARRAGVRKVAFAGPTAVTRTYGLERWYRVMSGLAHGLEWARVGLTLTRDDREPLPGIRTGTFTASEPVLAGATRISVVAASDATAAIVAYYGAPSD